MVLEGVFKFEGFDVNPLILALPIGMYLPFVGCLTTGCNKYRSNRSYYSVASDNTSSETCVALNILQ